MAKSRKSKNNQESEELLVDLSQTTDQVTDYFENNQNTILGIIIGLFVIVGGYYAYTNFVQKPKQDRAVAEMYQSEMQFSRDSFAQALTNPGGGFLGFIDIIDEYSGTNSANLAKYYAGVSYLNLGDFAEAIEYLNDFSTSDEALSIAKFSALGDAHSELGDMGKAENMYKKALGEGDIPSLSTILIEKLALISMKNGNNDQAVEYFNKIKLEYPNSPQAKEVDKYLSMIN